MNRNSSIRGSNSSNVQLLNKRKARHFAAELIYNVQIMIKMITVCSGWCYKLAFSWERHVHASSPPPPNVRDERFFSYLSNVNCL